MVLAFFTLGVLTSAERREGEVAAQVWAAMAIRMEQGQLARDVRGEGRRGDEDGGRRIVRRGAVMRTADVPGRFIGREARWAEEESWVLVMDRFASAFLRPG